MVVLQVFQAKLLQAMDESGPNLEAFRDLRSARSVAQRGSRNASGSGPDQGLEKLGLENL